MGEYFILANDSTEQVIDPDNFPTDQLGPKFANWMAQAHTSILTYLTVQFGGGEPTGAWCGAWAGNNIRLLGDGHSDYEHVRETYQNVSSEVYHELTDQYEWFPDAALWDDYQTSVSTPAETREALDDLLDETDLDE